MNETLLSNLDVLVGEWTTHVPAFDGHGQVTFEWLSKGGFLIQRSSIDRPEFPDGISLFGATGPDGALQMHYYDSRGVHRLYDVTFEDRVLTIHRDGPDWPQRYVGKVSEDGQTVDGRWERGERPGAELQHDFDVIYRRVR
jgi:hypothetical protein